MKKLIIILAAFLSLTTYSQVKISQMPLWTGTLDSAYVPIVINLVNYKTLGRSFNKDRIDSIVNNWSVVSGAQTWQQTLDVAAGNILTHDNHIAWTTSGAYDFNMRGAKIFDFTAGDSTFTNDAAQVYIGGEDENAQVLIYSQIDATNYATITAFRDYLSFFSTDSLFQINLSENSSETKVVTFNTSTRELHWIGISDLPSGGGAGTSINADNGLTMRNDSTVVLGGTADENTTNVWGAFSWTHTLNGLVNDGIIISSTSTAIADGSSTVSIAVSGALSNGATQYALKVANNRTGTTTGYAILGSLTSGTPGAAIRGEAATSGIAVQGINSSSGQGVIGQSSSGIGVWAIASSGTALAVNSTTGLIINTNTTSLATTNGSSQIATIIASANGSPTTNFGAYFSYNLEQATGGSTIEAYRSDWYWTDATTGSASSSYAVWTRDGGTLTKKTELTGGGNFKLLTAGKGLALTSPDGTVYYGTISNAGVLSWSTTAP